MDNIMYTHPLDRLIDDNSIFMLEALIPFVDYNMKRVLVLFIKAREMKCLMEKLNNPRSLASSGFDCHVNSMEEMVEKMCSFLPPEFAQNIRQTIKMMNMMQMMEQMEAANSKKDSMNISGDNLFDDVMTILNDYDSQNMEQSFEEME